MKYTSGIQIQSFWIVLILLPQGITYFVPPHRYKCWFAYGEHKSTVFISQLIPSPLLPVILQYFSIQILCVTLLRCQIVGAHFTVLGLNALLLSYFSYSCKLYLPLQTLQVPTSSSSEADLFWKYSSTYLYLSSLIYNSHSQLAENNSTMNIWWLLPGTEFFGFFLFFFVVGVLYS